MSSGPRPQPFPTGWTAFPIHNFTLSASGLLALADLNTVANRTVISGGSSWLDSLVLAPGMHYEQAAGVVGNSGEHTASAVDSNLTIASSISESTDDDEHDSSFAIKNIAMLKYLTRLGKEGGKGDIWLDVGMPGKSPQRQRIIKTLRGLLKKDKKRRAMADKANSPPIDWFSNTLYLLSPLLTAVALTFMILLRDWWGLSVILALIISRILNIFTIKARLQPGPVPAEPPSPQKKPLKPTPASDPDRVREYAVDLGNNRRVILRGNEADLRAVTTQEWLRRKTDLDGFLEAAAKLIVYMVAVFSGNVTQAGQIILMGLLVVSAGLLGLSNAHSNGFNMHGRVARVDKLGASSKKAQSWPLADEKGPAPGDDRLSRRRSGHGAKTWPMLGREDTLLDNDTDHYEEV